MGYSAKKHFSQNFLRDTSIIDRIASLIRPQPHDHIVEIGPGLGALTAALLPPVAYYDAIEIDRDLIASLSARFPKAHIHAADILRVDLSTFTPQPLRIVGNLPYHISSPILFHCLNALDCIQDLHFMLQKEVVDRIVAPPNSKTYGRLSVMVQYHCRAERLLDVDKGAFTPIPSVDSSIVRLTPEKPFIAKNVATFSALVKQAFAQRRKMLRKSLQLLVTPDLFIQAEIDATMRPEQLSVADFVRLANNL